MYKKDDILYLSSDATEEMEIFQQDKIYVIGGLVDHNRLKNTTHEWAIKNNIKTVRLPIKKYLALQ